MRCTDYRLVSYNTDSNLPNLSELLRGYLIHWDKTILRLAGPCIKSSCTAVCRISLCTFHPFFSFSFLWGKNILSSLRPPNWIVATNINYADSTFPACFMSFHFEPWNLVAGSVFSFIMYTLWMEICGLGLFYHFDQNLLMDNYWGIGPIR